MKQRGCSITAGVLITLTMSLLATAAEDVPFKGRSGGLITNVGFDPAQNIVYLNRQGTGQTTHLGRFTVDGNIEILISEGIARSNVVLTAANGDKLFLRGDGQGTGPTTAVEKLKIIGGTGRFEGASGLLQFALTFAIAPPTSEPNPYTDVIEGAISLKQQ